MIGQTKEGVSKVHLSILSSVTAEYLCLAEVTAPNKLEYAMRWGYGLNLGRLFKRDYDAWGTRQVQILHSLALVDWLWFMGADTVITNMTIDAAQFCDPDFDGVIGIDVNGINNDSWFIRSCPNSYEFLQRVLRLRDRYPNDQEAMKAVLGLLPDKSEVMPGFRMKYVSQRLFNSYLYGEPEYGSYSLERKMDVGGPWVYEDFVVHFAGIDLPRRLMFANRFLNAVVR